MSTPPVSSPTPPATAARPAVQILFVEDDEDVRAGSAQALEIAGLTVREFGSVEQARAHVQPGAPVVVLCDVNLPGTSGTEWLEELHRLDPELPVILVTGRGDIAMAVQAMRSGAYDFIEKPFASEHLVHVVKRALDKRALTLELKALQAQVNEAQGLQAQLIGRSAALHKLRRQVMMLATTGVDVLIYGETGTGKELVARCLHDHSRRRDRHFVAINCGGLPESLFESELFGHEAGAFTSAGKRRIGKIEHANGGTLLLDEIESMPMAMQIKLLRVLQERKVERLGANDPVPVNLRVLAATKADLRELSEQQAFRGDLYYRLNVAVLQLPPLRERRDDVPLLFEHFVAAAKSRYGLDAPDPTPGYLRELMSHDWPGNVREMRNVADRFVLEGGPGGFGTPDESPASLAQQMDLVEKSLIEQALRRHQGRVPKVMEVLGIAKKTLYDKLHRHGIDPDRFR